MKLLLIAVLGFLGVASSQNASSSFFPNNAVYDSWLQSHQSSYANAQFIPSDSQVGGAGIFWTISDNKTIHLAVAVEASGWVGVGVRNADRGSSASSLIILLTQGTQSYLSFYSSRKTEA
jgi:hypothetical protein